MDAQHVLVISPDPGRRAALAATLRAAGHQVVVAQDGAGAVAALSEPGIEVLALDLRLPELDAQHLRAALQPAAPAAPDTLEDAERRHITHVLRYTDGNKRQAAILLHISRSTLLHKLRKYGIVVPRA